MSKPGPKFESILRAENPFQHLSRRSVLAIAGLLAVSFVAAASNVGPGLPRTGAPARTAGPPIPFSNAYGQLPIHFEPNVGQFDPRVRYVAHGGDHSSYFTDSGVMMVLRRGQPFERNPGRRESEPREMERAVVRLTLAGSRHPIKWVGLEKHAGVSNYFLGNDRRRWRTGVPTYRRVEARGIYPGVDLMFYGNQRQMEYDFVVAPGADPNQIQVAYDGVDSVRVDANGQLVLRTELGEIRQEQPRVYQDIGGTRLEIGARYTMVARNRVGFELATYDRNREVRIDPVLLVYSTYLSGSELETHLYGIAVDGAGSAYVAGYTDALNFPIETPYQATLHESLCSTLFDAVVAKLTPAGNALVYSTYLGGNCFDVANGIAVDREGSAYIAGMTTSSDFPTESPFQADLLARYGNAFVTKLAPGGDALVYSTYLGGTDPNEEGGLNANSAYAIAVDGAGSAYVTGVTGSKDFPVTPSVYQTTPAPSVIARRDAFVTKFTPKGDVLVYSTFLGGSDWDWGRGIAVDAAGSAYVTGMTASTNFPTKSAYQSTHGRREDAFVTKLTPKGDALVFSTYLGGSFTDAGTAIAIDPTGAVYITGGTQSPDFPTQTRCEAAAAWGNAAFVAKFAPNGGAPVYLTCLGVDGYNLGMGIAVDGAGSAYITGETESKNFPTRSALQPDLLGLTNAFVTKLTPAGDALIYSTYVGGSARDSGAAIAVDAAGSAYITGSTRSTDFPVQSPYQASLQSSGAFVAKLAPGGLPSLSAAGVVSAASFAGGGVAPGEIVSIFGSNLGPSTGVSTAGFDSSTGALATALAGVNVYFDGQAAPLFFVRNDQINAQVPFEVAGKGVTSIVVSYEGAASAAITVPVRAVHPGIFGWNNRALILNAVTGTVIDAAHPISRGDWVTIYGTGPGLVDPAIATGKPGQAMPLSKVPVPQAQIGGRAVTVDFAGMAPGFVGLLQMNLQIPADAPTGTDVPLRLSVNGVPAHAYLGSAPTPDLTIAIQ